MAFTQAEVNAAILEVAKQEGGSVDYATLVNAAKEYGVPESQLIAGLSTGVVTNIPQTLVNKAVTEAAQQAGGALNYSDLLAAAKNYGVTESQVALAAEANPSLVKSVPKTTTTTTSKTSTTKPEELSGNLQSVVDNWKTGLDPNVVNIANQIISQGTSDKWKGEGAGSAEANALYMADSLAKLGITDISQFGTWQDDQGNTVYGNKETGQAVSNTYGERQTGNAWSGTYAGKGNTAYRVQFAEDGTPIFYTTEHSSNDLANLLEDPLLGTIANIGAAYFGGPMGAAALQLAQGKDIEDAAKAAALAYAGKELIGGLNTGDVNAINNANYAGLGDAYADAGTSWANATDPNWINNAYSAGLGNAYADLGQSFNPDITQDSSLMADAQANSLAPTNDVSNFGQMQQEWIDSAAGSPVLDPTVFPPGTKIGNGYWVGPGGVAMTAAELAKAGVKAASTVKSVADAAKSGLSTAGLLTGAAGLTGLLAAINEDNKRYGTPGVKENTFNIGMPTGYKPNIPDPNMFKPRPGTVTTVADQQALMAQLAAQNAQNVPTMAQGGSIGKKQKKPVYTPHAKLASMSAWDRAAAEYENQAYKAQMPTRTTVTEAPTGPSLGQLNLAHGGQLGGYSDGGRMLKGDGDGMSDSIPATISGKQPARLADGEFVIPADVVSHLGNGSTDAGARQLYKMLDQVRQARTGRKAQGKQINPAKFMPKMG